MGCIGKSLSLLLVVILAVSSLMIVEFASAQSIPTPSVPEFSLEYINTSYFSSPISTTDPYTGQNQSYRNTIIERGIIVTIKNQPFTQPIDNNGLLAVNEPCLFYLFQWKGHYSSTWMNSSRNSLYPDQNFTYTVARLSVDGNIDNSFGGFIQLEGIQDVGKLDFQVQAFIGYYKYIPTPTQLNPFYPTSSPVFVGKSSGWSNTQTINLANGSVSTSTPKPTPTPTVPELQIWIILPLFTVVILLSIVLVRNRIRNK
jgi:hypothetical protein